MAHDERIFGLLQRIADRMVDELSDVFTIAALDVMDCDDIRLEYSRWVGDDGLVARYDKINAMLD